MAVGSDTRRIIPVMTKLIKGYAPLTVLFSSCAAGGPSYRIYVSNVGGDLTIVERARGIHASPDGTLVYIALSGSPAGRPNKTAAGIFGIAAKKILRELLSGSDPEQFAGARDGVSHLAQERRDEFLAIKSAGGVRIGDASHQRHSGDPRIPA
jgi:hypothetical protein